MLVAVAVVVIKLPNLIQFLVPYEIPYVGKQEQKKQRDPDEVLLSHVQIFCSK